MPRKRFELNPTSPYHVSARSNGRDWFALPLNEVWEIVSRYLFFLHYGYGVRIHGFVLMANHWHLLAQFPESNFSEAMNYFMRETSRCISHESRRINHVYGGRCFRSEIVTAQHFSHAYKYVYRNPVEAGLVRCVEEYEFSTLGALLGQRRTIIPLCADHILFESDFAEVLLWLNQVPEVADRESVRTGLRKSKFRLAINRNTGKVNRLETQPY